MAQQLGEGLGGTQSPGGLSGMLLQQIEDLKKGLGYGEVALGVGGKAESGWGLGTSPYAVTPAPADSEQQIENRQGDASLGDTPPVDFEPLYAPEEYAHGFSEEGQLHGRFDVTQPPQKVEEVRSAPETQDALVDFANIIGSYAEGEESAIDREQIPHEYQEMVRAYFDQIESAAASSENDETEPPASDEGEE